MSESTPQVAVPAPSAPPAPALAPDQAYSLRWLLLGWIPLAGVVVLGLGRLAFGRDALSPERHLMTLGSLWLYAALLSWQLSSARCSGLSIASTFGPRPRPAWLPEAGAVAWLHLQINGALFLLLLAVLHHAWPEASRLWSEAGGKAMAFGGTPPWLQWVIIVGLAPLCEEWLFRGVLYHRFARRFGPGASQLLTSAVFALLHMNPFGVFALGMLLQALYRRTRSLATCVLAHALNNAVPLLLMSWDRGEAPEPGMRSPELARIAAAWPAWLLMSAALVGLLVWHLRRRWPARTEPTPWQDAPTPPAG